MCFSVVLGTSVEQNHIRRNWQLRECGQTVLFKNLHLRDNSASSSIVEDSNPKLGQSLWRIGHHVWRSFVKYGPSSRNCYQPQAISIIEGFCRKSFTLSNYIDILNQYLILYNTKRIKISLGNINPWEYWQSLGPTIWPVQYCVRPLFDSYVYSKSLHPSFLNSSIRSIRSSTDTSK